MYRTFFDSRLMVILGAATLAGCGSDSGTLGSSAGASSDDEGAAELDGGPRRDAGTHGGNSHDAPGSSSAAGTQRDGGKVGDKSAAHLPCDVQDVVSANCAECHGVPTAYGAPMSLVSLADFQGKASNGTTLLATIHTRINDTNPQTAMPPSTGMKLSAAQLTTMNDWIGAGAPGSTATCSSTATPPAQEPDAPSTDTTGLDCFKLTAHGDGSSPFAVGTAVDAYYNFTFTAPWTDTRYGVVFRPIIDNKKALHHFLLFQNLTPAATSPAARSTGAHPDGQLVFGWAPGGQPLDFRVNGDVGMELSGSVSYTLEFHYNSSDPTAKDASGVELCVAKTKPTHVAGISWLGYDNLLVPSTTWVGQCVPTNSEPVHIIGVQPHMHVTGTHMKAIIHRKGGADEVLHDEPFDFNNQIHYDKDVILNPGDTVTTTCTYNQPMAFGESTGQEMCYLFTTAYAKGVLKDNGAWGGVAHGGSACLGQ